jgi:transcriptional regulator with XRE-family HTH domain
MTSEREQITAARRDLGRQLAAWRTKAGLTQQALARRTGYARSTIASAEHGEPVSAGFWQAVDRALGAHGALTARHARIAAAVTAHRQRTARLAWLARAQAAEPPALSAPDQVTGASQDVACPRCGDPLTLSIQLIAPPRTQELRRPNTRAAAINPPPTSTSCL